MSETIGHRLVQCQYLKTYFNFSLLSTDQQITWYDERPEEHSQENDIVLVIFKRLLSLTIEKYKTVYCKTICC